MTGAAMNRIAALDRIALKNFRCFRNVEDVRLAPLTLLVGENSTGKTSFMAMIRALWDVAYQQRVPDFKEPPYDLGSFDEIAHYRGEEEGRADSFTAGFKACENYMHLGNKMCNFDVEFGEMDTAPVLTAQRLSYEDNSVWIEHRRIPQEMHRVSFGTSRGSWKWEGTFITGHVWVDDKFVDPFYIVADGVKRQIVGNERGSNLIGLSGFNLPGLEDWKLVEDLCSFGVLPMRSARPYAGAPVRSKPHRTYDPSRPTRDPEGDYIPMYLANLYIRDKKKWKKIKALLEKFGRASGLFNEISIKTFGSKGSGPFQIQIGNYEKPSRGLKRNLTDVGYGVSQALPVVTELFHDDSPPMLLLQQPEVHLHPSAQAALGSLFCEVASSGRQLIVETHSDYILDRVRLDVRDRKTELKVEDVSVLFFERGNLDVQIHSIRIDEMGNILDAPSSYRQFFMDETKRALNL